VNVVIGVDLGSTTTKAVMLDERGRTLGRGITNSRSNYHLAADIARDEAFVGARFALLEGVLAVAIPDAKERQAFHTRLLRRFRRHQHLSQLAALRDRSLEEAEAPRVAGVASALRTRLEVLFRRMEDDARRRLLTPSGSEFFRDLASSEYSRLADQYADRVIDFELLMSIFDKAILAVENARIELGFSANIEAALAECLERERQLDHEACRRAVRRVTEEALTVVATIGTGYGRQRLPFAREEIRSEILCHGLGAHAMFPGTATVLDIGGQDTKAIQVDADGIVTSFQMNDRCAAGCGRYLGYIADEMNLGVHELGPMASKSTRRVKISSTCTVFAGAELRDRLTMGQKREDILAGLHRAIILRAMALLARSGGVEDEFTFTGGVANNEAAVAALCQLVEENYGHRTINISPASIYTGALGAALFALRAAERGECREVS
jgi:benzoyl-CoA reductase subunit A